MQPTNPPLANAKLVDQLLEGARDQLRNAHVDDAVALLENAVELVKQDPASIGATTAKLLRDVSLLVNTGTRFWAEWARLLSPDAGVYTPAGDFVLAQPTISRVALRG